MISILNTRLFYNKTFFISIFLLIIILFNIIIFYDTYFQEEITIYFLEKIHVFPKNLSTIFKISYLIAISITYIFILNIIYNKFINNIASKASLDNEEIPSNNSLVIGKDLTNGNIISIPEKGLYQNILITGTIGTGKTSSAMYPFTKQLLKMNVGMLVLDVKGNFHKKLKELANILHKNVIVIELRWKIYLQPTRQT